MEDAQMAPTVIKNWAYHFESQNIMFNMLTYEHVG